MTELLLSTKLYIPPPRSNVVVRPRLIKQLMDGLDGKLTLVSAPAGFGKSTLLSAWAAQSKNPVAWLSLDERDNDPVRFLSYFSAALQCIDPRFLQSLPSTSQGMGSLGIEAAMAALINEIASLSWNIWIMQIYFSCLRMISGDGTATIICSLNFYRDVFSRPLQSICLSFIAGQRIGSKKRVIPRRQFLMPSRLMTLIAQ